MVEDRGRNQAIFIFFGGCSTATLPDAYKKISRESIFRDGVESGEKKQIPQVGRGRPMGDMR